MNDFLEHSRLALPVVPQAHRRGIGRLAAEQLSICIPAYPGMDEGDLLELFWDGCYVTSRQVLAGEQGQPVSLRVPQSFILDGVARIHYRVMRVGSAALTSPQLKLPVKLNCPGGRGKSGPGAAGDPVANLPLRGQPEPDEARCAACPGALSEYGRRG